MVVYYRGPYVRVTHELFEVLRPAYQAFVLRDLADLRVVEAEADRAAVAPLRSGSTGMAGAAAVVVALRWTHDRPVFDSPVLAVGLLVILLLSLAVLGTCWRMRRFQYELVAVYRDRVVTLFRTFDAREFGQVTRAVIRAIQRIDDTR
jgi:hypothetical protein